MIYMGVISADLKFGIYVYFRLKPLLPIVSTVFLAIFVKKRVSLIFHTPIMCYIRKDRCRCHVWKLSVWHLSLLLCMACKVIIIYKNCILYSSFWLVCFRSYDPEAAEVADILMSGIDQDYESITSVNGTLAFEGNTGFCIYGLAQCN